MTSFFESDADAYDSYQLSTIPPVLNPKRVLHVSPDLKERTLLNYTPDRVVFGNPTRNALGGYTINVEFAVGAEVAFPLWLQLPELPLQFDIKTWAKKKATDFESTSLVLGLTLPKVAPAMNNARNLLRWFDRTALDWLIANRDRLLPNVSRAACSDDQLWSRYKGLTAARVSEATAQYASRRWAPQLHLKVPKTAVFFRAEGEMVDPLEYKRVLVAGSWIKPLVALSLYMDPKGILMASARLIQATIASNPYTEAPDDVVVSTAGAGKSAPRENVMVDE